jgi:hypothetical protein
MARRFSAGFLLVSVGAWYGDHMLTFAQSAFESRQECIHAVSADGPATLERFISVGNPTIVAEELRGSEAASTALLELAAADALSALSQDDPITQEFVVPRYRREDFNEDLIDALIALECGDGEHLVLEDPVIEADVISFRDLRVMESLLEPYFDFATLAANV